MNSFSLFDQAYAQALGQIMDASAHKNERTGKMVKAKAGIALHTPPGFFPLVRLRDIKPLWTCAEVVWFMSGSKDAKWMDDFGFKVWNKFADEAGLVWSATGYRWRHHFDVDQLKEVMAKLRRDPTTRQAVLLSWDPYQDLLNPGPNAPCVMIWHLHVVDGMLHVSVLQRSADMYFGLPHDILGTKLVLELMAAGLGLRSGGISYLVSNAHLYEDQWEAAEEMMYRADMANHGSTEYLWDNGGWDLRLSADDFARAYAGDRKLVTELHVKLMEHYTPWPTISGPKLVR